MSDNQHRYVQPHNAHEAMALVEKLFNEYRNAPLTQELLNYHLGLVQRLQTDIKRAADLEGNAQQSADLESMTKIMQDWTQLRLAGHPFTAKMKHFKLSTPHQRFKRHVHKIKGHSPMRSSRH